MRDSCQDTTSSVYLQPINVDVWVGIVYNEERDGDGVFCVYGERNVLLAMVTNKILSTYEVIAY